MTRKRWLPVFHFTGDFYIESLHYEANRNGQVRNSRTLRVLKPRINKAGYAVVDLCGKTWNLHSIIYRTFNGNPPSYSVADSKVLRMVVDHKNNRKDDARRRNLQLLTHLDNTRKSLSYR